jgi:hypothetical protein
MRLLGLWWRRHIKRELLVKLTLEGFIIIDALHFPNSDFLL